MAANKETINFLLKIAAGVLSVFFCVVGWDIIEHINMHASQAAMEAKIDGVQSDISDIKAILSSRSR